tara:strand:+ start:74910 stop:75290 length:381 start_codon:yes stop_codon:yes gene_type:complete
MRNSMNQKNVFDSDLVLCCNSPMTGFYRDGFCNTGEEDYGLHHICCRVTNNFLVFSKSVGNDLSTPVPQFNFPGLKDGDKWCICAHRWLEAYNNDCAPDVYLLSSNIKCLDIIPLNILKKFSVDLD